MCTSHLYPPGTHFCSRLSQPQGHTAAVRIMSMNNSNNPTGNRTHDLLACGAVPQARAPPHTPKYFSRTEIFLTSLGINCSPLVLQPITYHYSDNANIFIICIKMFESMHICSITGTVWTTLINLIHSSIHILPSFVSSKHVYETYRPDVLHATVIQLRTDCISILLKKINNKNLDFKLSPCSERCVLSSG